MINFGGAGKQKMASSEEEVFEDEVIPQNAPKETFTEKSFVSPSREAPGAFSSPDGKPPASKPFLKIGASKPNFSKPGLVIKKKFEMEVAGPTA